MNELIEKQTSEIALTANGLKISKVAECWGFSKLLETSGMLPQKMDVPKAVVAMIAGAKLGLDPFQSVQSIAVIGGKPSVYGDALVAICQASMSWLGIETKLLCDATDENKQGYEVTAKRALSNGTETSVTSKFTVSDAKRAGLWSKPGPWQQYPRRMLFNRARAFALRDLYADLIKGIGIVEEEQDRFEGRTIEFEAEPVSAEKKPRARRRITAAEILAADTAANANKTAQDAPLAHEPTTAALEPTPPPEREMEAAVAAPAPSAPAREPEQEDFLK